MLFIVGELSLLRISELLEKIVRNNVTLRNTKEGTCRLRWRVLRVVFEYNAGNLEFKFGAWTLLIALAVFTSLNIHKRIPLNSRNY